MKATMRKGFTLVELLFVMAIIAILAGFAIANLKDSSRVATVNSMKNDARNAIAVEQTYFAENQAYDTVSCTEGTDDTNGRCTGDSDPAAVFTISKGNTIAITTADCGNGVQGFNIEVTNAQYPDTVTFNSCTDGKIQHANNNA